MYFRIASPRIFTVFSSISFSLRIFPVSFAKNYTNWKLRSENISVWSRLFHNLVSLCWSQFKFRAKFYNFSVRRIWRWCCHFAENPHLLTVTLFFINPWYIMPYNGEIFCVYKWVSEQYFYVNQLRKLLGLPRFQFRFNFFNWLYLSLRLHTLLYNEKSLFRLFYVNRKHLTFFYWKLFVFYVVKACPWNFGTTLETIMEQRILDEIHLDNYIGNIFI